jgi:hypothetical protein
VDAVRQVAQAVLYEGYLLWPYRRSALKNRHRWTLGGVYPEPYSRARGGDDPCLSRTECLLHAPAGAELQVRVRFLHVVARDVARLRGGSLEPVAELTVAGETHLTWEEATEREVGTTVPVAELAGAGRRVPIHIPAGSATEWLGDPPAGALTRSWQALRGRVDITVEPVADTAWRVAVTVVNSTECPDVRQQALARTFKSAHTVLHCDDGQFVSLMDPPDQWREQAEQCRNVGTWPVLAGEAGDHRTMLASPIILYDHPRVSPESPGDLFDATEIDQLLTLNVLALTDEEKQEMRASDPRAREILDRCDALSPEELMALHGRLRQLRPLPEGGS